MNTKGRCGMLPAWQWQQLVHNALVEDVGTGDLTSEAVIPLHSQGKMLLRARNPLVMCGTASLSLAFSEINPEVSVFVHAKDGEFVPITGIIAEIQGPVRALLAGERVVLNILQWLSGIATTTHEMVQLVQGLDTRILDTRKTTPTLRAFEKYAVRTGGGHNHRRGLYDAVLIKDNHIASGVSISEAVARARGFGGHTVFIEVEVDTLEQLDEALGAHPDGILLDNMTIAELKEAVRRVDHRCFLEASGGVNAQTIRAIAETGVDAASMGYLTQSAPAVDIGADWGETDE